MEETVSLKISGGIEKKLKEIMKENPKLKTFAEAIEWAVENVRTRYTLRKASRYSIIFEKDKKKKPLTGIAEPIEIPAHIKLTPGIATTKVPDSPLENIIFQDNEFQIILKEKDLIKHGLNAGSFREIVLHKK